MNNFDIDFYKKRLKKMYMRMGIILTFLGMPTMIKGCANMQVKLENSEKLNIKDDILDDVINVYKNKDTDLKNNVAFACGWFSKVLESGSISVDNTYRYDNNKELKKYLDDDDYNCILGVGVCRNENLLISNLLNLAGFDTVPLCSSLNKKDDHLYVLIYDHDIDKKYIFDYTNKGFWEINNLDNISYIYDKKEVMDTFNKINKINLKEKYSDEEINDYISVINSYPLKKKENEAQKHTAAQALLELYKNQIHNTECEISIIKTHLQDTQKKIFGIETDREHYSEELSNATSQYLHAQDVLKDIEQKVDAKNKEIIEADKKVHQQQALYEQVRSEREITSKKVKAVEAA